MTDRRSGAEQAARDLTSALDRMSAQLEAVRDDSEARDAELAAYGRRNRHLILGTIASVILDVVLTVTLAIVAVQAHSASVGARHAAVAARHASASNFALCEAGNTARAQQIQLWEFLLSLGSKPKTAQQKHVITEFKAQLHHIFAPRDCAALVKKAH